MDATLMLSQSVEQQVRHRVLTGSSVAAHMVAEGLGGDVTVGLSVVDGAVEDMVRVEIRDASPYAINRLWARIRDAHGLRCGWITAADYSGCILDWEWRDALVDETLRWVLERDTSRATVAA